MNAFDLLIEHIMLTEIVHLFVKKHFEQVFLSVCSGSVSINLVQLHRTANMVHLNLRPSQVKTS